MLNTYVLNSLTSNEQNHMTIVIIYNKLTTNYLT